MPSRIRRVDSVLVDSLLRAIYNQENRLYRLSKIQLSRRAQTWYEVYRILELKRRYHLHIPIFWNLWGVRSPTWY